MNGKWEICGRLHIAPVCRRYISRMALLGISGGVDISAGTGAVPGALKLGRRRGWNVIYKVSNIYPHLDTDTNGLDHLCHTHCQHMARIWGGGGGLCKK